MSIFVNNNSDALLLDSPVTVDDVNINGLFTDQNGYIKAIRGGTPTNYSQGIPVDSTGRVCVQQDGTIATWQNGLPYDANNRLCITANEALSTTNGIPFAERLKATTPTLNLNFTNKILDSRITFTRSSSATFIGDNGLIQTAGVNVPRFDHNPITKECLGLLVEEQRTNLLLNSENLSTQTVTVTAVAHALSFYGTGTVVLSGAHSATVNGNGAYPARTVLVFTPAAGSLTLTITGTVQFANLEAGAFATSYIPTTGAAATRAACLTRINTLSPWYNSTEGTLLAEGSRYGAGLTSGIMVGFSQNLIFAQSMYISNDAAFGNTVSFFVFNGGLQADMNGVLSSGVTNNFKAALAYQENNFARSMNGGAVVTDTSGTVPAVSNLTIGSSPWTTGGDNNWSGWIRRVSYWPIKIPNTTLTQLTS